MERPKRISPWKRLVICILGTAACFLLVSCSMFSSDWKVPVKAKYEPPPPPPCELPYCDTDLNLPLNAITKPKIYIYKSERRLRLVNDTTLVREYKVGLGPNPTGNKFFQGDGRTPEGEYFICSRNPSSKYYKSLGINYPGPKRAVEACAVGEISREDLQKILDANDRKVLPPSNTCLGGAVFIHGGGSYEDWTLGCVAVSNRYMDELFEVIPVGTPVFIMP